MRISDFWWHVIRLMVGVSLIIFGLSIDFHSAWKILQGFSVTLGLILLFLFLVIMGDELYLIYPIKYRIIKKEQYQQLDGKIKYNYLPQVFRFKWLVFPAWYAVNTKLHSYKTQNIFGAKDRGYYYTDVNFDSEDEARRAIEIMKGCNIEDRKELFARPQKNTDKIINI